MKIDTKRLNQIIYTKYRDTIKDYQHNNNESITINYEDLEQYYTELAQELPYQYNQITRQITQIIQQNTIQNNKTIQITYKNVPITPIRKLHKDYNTQFVAFEGLIRKKGKTIQKLEKGVYECTSCGNTLVKEYDIDDIKINKPKLQCTDCGGKHWKLSRELSTFQNVQLITVQEPLEEVQGSTQPVSIDCYLYNKETNANPGDKVTVNGLLDIKPGRDHKNVFTEYIDVKSIEKLDEDYETVIITPEEEQQIKTLAQSKDIFQRLIQSTIPSIQGYTELKEAIAFQLFGTDSYYNKGAKHRGDIHVLIIGDPGIGKSQIMKYISNIAPRGLYTSGKSASGAGLTASAVKDEVSGDWTLDAGAMVLGDMGTVCIDEFDKMRASDRSAIHEALEQQTISFAKAGIVATLNSRCSVIAAANPLEGKFNPRKALSEQIGLSAPILSRFDLIFIIEDIVNKEKDRAVALHILSNHDEKEEEKLIKPTLLKKYISYAKKNIHPVLSNEAIEVLVNFYTDLRGTVNLDIDNPIPITARQLEAIKRLALASARIRLSNIVSIEDAERAIQLQQYCMSQVGVDPETGKVDVALVEGVTPRNDSDTMTVICSVLKQLEKEWDGKVPEKVLYSELEAKRSLKHDKIKDLLKKLKINGVILNPRDGYYATT